MKLSRAAKHVAELSGEISAYRARAPIFAIPQSDPDNPDMIIADVVVAEAVPPHWAAIIGDAIHNLRTSLDLLACDLVRLNKQSDKDVYFPFAESEEQLEVQIKRRHVDRAHPDAVDLIREFKPYVGGNVPLRLVHDLDILDKHRAIMPAIVEVALLKRKRGMPAANFSTGVLWRTNSHRMLFEDNPVVLGKKIAAEITLMFPYDQPIIHRQLVPTLEELVQDFSRIVDAFEALCLGTLAE